MDLFKMLKRGLFGNKRGAELTLNIIIIAILVLVVLVVMIVIFSGKIRGFTSGVDKQSQPYSGDDCYVPGTSRKCASQLECIRPVQGQFDDCADQGLDCCFTR